MAAIIRCEGIGARLRNINKPFAKAFAQAMEQAGIRPSQKSRKVSDFVLQNLIMEGPNFQDWAAQHVKLEEVKRRVRIYQVRQGSTPEERSAIERAALREFQLLETLQHPGILRTHGFTEHELGSAIIFEHYPEDECLRLDHFLAQRGERLEPEVRLDLIRQIANVVRFAHNKRVVHRIVVAAEHSRYGHQQPISKNQDLQLARWLPRSFRNGWSCQPGGYRDETRRRNGRGYLDSLHGTGSIS